MEPEPKYPQDRFKNIRQAENTIGKMSYEEMQELIKKYQSQKRQAYQNKSKGKIQGPKYDPQYEKQLHSEKLSQSILAQQNKNSKREKKGSFPSTEDKFNSNLDETGTGQYQPSDSQYSYSQSDESNYQPDGNASLQVPTIDHTANTSNFSYKTKIPKNQLGQFSQVLQWNELDISNISAKSESPITKDQIKHLEQQFDQTFKLLKYQKTPRNLLRAMTSREQLRSQPDLYFEDRKTFLFKMVLPTQNGLALNKIFYQNLQKTDHFLLNQVDIGVQIGLKHLLKIFEKYYQSWRKFRIQRALDEDFEEHGFNFIKNIQNQHRLVEIEWKSAKLTKTLVSSFEASELKNLIQLTIDLDQKVQNEKECGNLISQIFNNIGEVNQKGFKIVLCSSVEKKQSLGNQIKLFKNRIEIKPKRKDNQKSEKQQKPNLDKQPEPSFNKKKNESGQPQRGIQSKTQSQPNNSQQFSSQQPHQSFSGFTFTSSGGQIKNFSIGGNQYSKS